MSPKDYKRLVRSTETAIARLEVTLNSIPRTPWHPDPVLVKKYNLIEFL